MKIVISGGGIAGLTLALTAKKAGHTPIILEQRDAVDKPSFGGGIGLWPPSQMVMERLGLLEQLEEHGLYMPSACYYNSQGYILGRPTKNFAHKFPVLCLERQQLSKSLYKKCQQQEIQIRTNARLQAAQSSPSGVTVHIQSSNTNPNSTQHNAVAQSKINADVLIGADGIGSKVRGIIMRERQLPEIVPYHCEYAYFRAVVNVSTNKSSEWHKHAFENWGQRRRFGYVPLKQPHTFWFVAIPIGQQGLQKTLGSHTCTQQQKQWLLKQFQHWHSPINIKNLISLTPANTILRTDICKVRNVTSFPWQSRHKNIIILGDSANATAPNLAQGAGLAIESAWDFVSMVDLSSRDKKGLDDYMKKRKRRAETVQGMADYVAKIGQLSNFYSTIRDFVMKNSTYHMKTVEQRIFQQMVSHSVGGDLKKLHWMPPNIPSHNFHKNLLLHTSLLAKIMGRQSYSKLPQLTKQFRRSFLSRGTGKVNVKSIAFGNLLGLPSNMSDKPFGAYCENYIDPDGAQWQIWTRVFGQGLPQATKYQTIHRSTPNLSSSKTGLVLTESLGIGPDILRFGYLPRVQKESIVYESKGLWFRNLKLPIPQFLLPSSEWLQKQTEKGWQFEGNIRLPKILGSLNIMNYGGVFQPSFYSHQIKPTGKRVVIAGGSGMIGKSVAKAFYEAGWIVEILSRGNSRNRDNLIFAKYHDWNPSQFQNQQQISKLAKILNKAEIVINLSGQNPGSGYWTQKVKQKILKSRLDSIRVLSSSLNKIQSANRPHLLQASAAGIYGNRNSEILQDSHEPGKEKTFRINTCRQIQKLIHDQFKDEGIIVRIGHVLSSEGGLFPHLQRASKLRASKFGRGGQYAPWVHIQDLAKSFVHISENLPSYKNKTINIASPNHLTYDQILSKLAAIRKRRACIIPIPQTLLKLALGQMASVLFDSQRMHPKLLLQNGFEFKYENLEKALASRQLL